MFIDELDWAFCCARDCFLASLVDGCAFKSCCFFVSRGGFFSFEDLDHTLCWLGPALVFEYMTLRGKLIISSGPCGDCSFIHSWILSEVMMFMGASWLGGVLLSHELLLFVVVVSGLMSSSTSPSNSRHCEGL